jgi:hypothetical protein
MSYTKTAYSLTNLGDPETQAKSLVKWANTEFTKLEEESRLPQVQGLKFEQLYEVPAKYSEGDLYYFAAGVSGAPGLFIRDNNSWRKL